MAPILDRFPFQREATAIRLPGGPSVVIRPLQIVVWLAATAPGLPGWPSRERRWPAILDTGFNQTLLIQEQHLRTWAKISTRDLIRTGSMIFRSEVEVPVYDAETWLFRNVPGHDRLDDRPPIRLELHRGIAVYPERTPGAPRLPLLGIQALVRNRLIAEIDGAALTVSMRPANIGGSA